MIFLSVLALFLNDLLAVIITALGANLVALLELVALRAFYKTGSFKFPVSKTGIRL